MALFVHLSALAEGRAPDRFDEPVEVTFVEVDRGLGRPHQVRVRLESEAVEAAHRQHRRDLVPVSQSVVRWQRR